MLTSSDLTGSLGAAPADPSDTAWVDTVVAATNAWVGRLPVLLDRPAPADPWPPDVELGALMLAQHLYHSRSAPYGRATLEPGAFQAAYADPEIARLLQLRRHRKPFVA